MPFVETGIFVIVLFYLWLGKELICPLGWYFGLPMVRTWWRDVIFVVFAGLSIILWLPIVIIAVTAYALN